MKKTTAALLLAAGVWAAAPLPILTAQAQEYTLTAEEADEIISFAVDKFSSGEMETEEEILSAIEEAEEKFGIKIGEEEKENLVKAADIVNSLGLNAKQLGEKAKELYEEYGDELLTHPEKAAASLAKKSVTGFFKNIGNSIQSFFQSVWERIFG